ncbi:pectate lyase family protein [Methylorubrum thiocyanatum]|uniref:hypothetical protein n=1 Tax=Methylorubrum thiocyanatum TaxID=47958 RepID=UPI0036521CC1
MAEFPPFAFTTQESWYGELSFKAAEDGSALSLAGRQFEMHITPMTSGAQLVPPALILTMDEGRGLSFKRTALGSDDTSTLVFRVPKETANAFPRQEYSADVLEVVGGDRYLFMPVRVTYTEPNGLRAFISRFLGIAVTFSARQQPIYTPLAVPGREGRPGATILRGTVPPVPADGKNDDYYIEDRTASGQGRRMWGPKAGGAWPGTPWTIQVAKYSDIPGLGSAATLDASGPGAAAVKDGAADGLTVGGAALSASLPVVQAISLPSTAAASSRAIPVVVQAFSTRGYAVEGDGGGAEFRRVASQPAHPGRLRTTDRFLPNGATDSANGGWWEISSTRLNIRMFGAKGDGIADDGPAIRSGYVAANALYRRYLEAPSGTYSIATTPYAADGVVLQGSGDCIIKAAPNRPAGFVLLEASFAINIGFEGLVIDGNWSNNPADGQTSIHLRNGSGNYIRRCVFKNAPWIDVIGNGDNQSIEANDFGECGQRNIFHLGLANAPTQNLAIKSNRFSGSKGHAINIGFANAWEVSSNYIRGVVLGLRGTLRVNVSGGTITFAGGPENFARIRPGAFLVMEGGKEWHVISKQSDTVLTIEGTGTNKDQFPAPGTNLVALVGSGDLLGMNDVQNGKCSKNTMIDTATYASGFIMTGGRDIFSNSYDGNTVIRSGKLGLAVACEASTGTIYDMAVVGNTFMDAGSGAAAVSDFDRSSIVMTAGGRPMRGIKLEGNTVGSDPGFGQVLNWLAFDASMPVGSVLLGKGNVSTVLNGRKIVGDVKSITLGAGWGSTAKTDSVVSTGDRVDFRIVAAGTGMAGYPNGSISKVSDVGSDPAVQSFIRSAAGPGDIRFPFISDGSTGGAWNFLWTSGTAPTADTIMAATFVAH